MNKRQLISLLILFSFNLSGWAQSTTQQLVVWQKNGEKVYFKLAELPETSFDNNLLVIRTKKTTVQYLLENIVRYTYEGVNTAIDLLPNERSVSISNESDAVTFQNLPEGRLVQVYAANGVLLETHRAESSQPLTVSIAQRPAGVYIVKYGSETIKLMKQ